MKGTIQKWKIMILLSVLLFVSNMAFAEDETKNNTEGNPVDTALVTSSSVQTNILNPLLVDSLSLKRYSIHRIGLEARPGYIFPTSSFFRGENLDNRPIENSLSLHLKYSFQFHPDTYTGRIYRGAYQGIGVAYYNMYEKQQLGNPLTVYLFQGARITRFNQRLSLNYEWNFGASFGWKPYHSDLNPYNKVIGSKVNAYLNTNFYFNWMLSPQFDFTTGVAVTHFSNGNTKFPNAGLNSIGLKVGLVYNINRKEEYFTKPLYQSPVPKFPRHISYDLVLFGSWRRKGVTIGEGQMVASPEAYPVLGFNFAPMYNFGYKFRAGISLDGVYDGSANVYSPDGYGNEFLKPSAGKQLALGVSGRAEYVMPYFTVGIGLGTNVIHAGGDLKSFYQILALKIEVTRSSFLHIGYNLQDFHDPNYLMLGFGFRFNNKYPTFHRR